MKEFIISKSNEGQRFDKYLSRIVGGGGMSFIFKMLRKKNFVLNDKKASGKEILKAGDNIKLYISDETYEKFKTKVTELFPEKNSNLDFSKLVIYEDKDIILINKPSNMLSQKAKEDDLSVNEYLIEYLTNKKEVSSDSLLEYKPSCVNRLDRNTTGIIVAAKNLKSAQVLSKSLKDRTIEKYYMCVVFGVFTRQGLHKGYLLKDKINNISIISDKSNHPDDEYIETEYSLIEANKDDGYSKLEVHLITGKSHQIRAHLSYLGFPIIGDPKYGDKDKNKSFHAKNQLLHAYKIVFPTYDDELDFAFSGKTFIKEANFKL